MVTYIQYVAGSNKGGIAQGDVFNSALGFNGSFGAINENRINYTGAPVVEAAAAGEFKPAWKPIEGKVYAIDADGVETEVLPDSEGTYTLPAGTVKAKYQYDNVIIPQNDLPILNAVTKDIPLIAKPRRIAIYYSQMAAYEMKMEMGEDLGQNLSEQAVSELKFEIDNEVILFLKKLAGDAAVTFNRTLPTGVSMAQHYEGFKTVINQVRSKIYNKTGRFAPNYMVCAIDVLEVLAFCQGFKAAAPKAIAGPYMAG